jgi:hypothetical protein
MRWCKIANAILATYDALDMAMVYEFGRNNGPGGVRLP